MVKKELFLPFSISTKTFKEWFVKYVAKVLGVPFRDSCCEGNNDGFPVRLSEDLSSLEYFDGSDWLIYGVLVTESTTTTTTAP